MPYGLPRTGRRRRISPGGLTTVILPGKGAASAEPVRSLRAARQGHSTACGHLPARAVAEDGGSPGHRRGSPRLGRRLSVRALRRLGAQCRLHFRQLLLRFRQLLLLLVEPHDVLRLEVAIVDEHVLWKLHETTLRLERAWLLRRCWGRLLAHDRLLHLRLLREGRQLVQPPQLRRHRVAFQEVLLRALLLQRREGLRPPHAVRPLCSAPKSACIPSRRLAGPPGSTSGGRHVEVPPWKGTERWEAPMVAGWLANL